MIIVGFSCKTNMILARIFCGKFKHCAIIVPSKNNFIIHQFVRRGNVAHIAITMRGISQLARYGWDFIYLKSPPDMHFNPNAWTCVNYAKHTLGIKKFWIQTPDALFRYLKKSDKNVRFFLFNFFARCGIKLFFPNMNNFVFVCWRTRFIYYISMPIYRTVRCPHRI